MEKSLEVMVKMLDMHGLRYRMEGKKFLYGETASNMTKPATQQDSLYSKMPYYSEYECLCPPGE